MLLSDLEPYLLRSRNSFQHGLPWTREFFIESDHTFYFMVFSLYFIFTFTHYVHPVIEEVDFDFKAEVVPNVMVVLLKCMIHPHEIMFIW